MTKRALACVVLCLFAACRSNSASSNLAAPTVASATSSTSSFTGGSFPQAPCIPNTTGGIALNVLNTTALLVDVTLTGPTGVTITLPPGGPMQTLALLPGNYTLTGVAPGTTNSVFAPSSWSVVNGCDYLLQIKSSPTPL
jgi:hypothetical protein